MTIPDLPATKASWLILYSRQNVLVSCEIVAAASWEEGPYHFVQLHYYPAFENAKMNIKNSLQWLERDLNLANVMNLTSSLFVHSATHLLESTYTRKILMKNKHKIAAIFAGHLHRCFGKKCAGLEALDKLEVDIIANKERLAKVSEKCFPASAALCNANVDRVLGSDLFSLSDMDKNLKLPSVKLYTDLDKEYTYINSTDNTLLCKRVTFAKNNIHGIPIFWSGASSFETFTLADFYHDHFVVNFITAAEGHEGANYVDVNELPNAVYPLHDMSDLDEVTIYI